MHPFANLAWFILFLPLGAAAAIALFTRRNRRLSAQLSIGAVVLSFLASLALVLAHPTGELRANWLTVGELEIEFGLKLDALSLLMLLIVTGVGGLIHIYSLGYMREDKGFSRFFASLSLFTFSMLGIVLSNNFLQMFIFWELVGVSSYLLIGFWYEQPSAADASKKAFITNRLGDFGFLLGMIALWAMVGSLNFTELQTALAAQPAALGAWAGIIGLLIFCGAMGKSAQFPLHVWLPDAMEGPTPVSALIHAATMVAAGVYMLCRVFFVYQVAPGWPEALGFLSSISALDIIAVIGGVTALLAALIAIQQDDIKRILAYSTLSQLGLMVLAVGVGGPSAAMFHLTTHAFFKALLFLGAGSVIHALHHEQDIWRMGGLRHKMPVTYWTFLVGTLALCGVPPLSGFYSKDSILAVALEHNLFLFALAVVVSTLTTFYMFRLLFVAFLGENRETGLSHAHESPWVMTWPLRLLAIPSAAAIFFWDIEHFLAPALAATGHADHALAWYERLFAAFNHAPLAAAFGLLATLVGFTLAFSLYAGASKDPLPEKLGLLAHIMRGRFYFDEIYAGLIFISHELLSRLAEWFDRWVIAGLGVRGTSGGTDLLGRALRLVQTGNLQTYAFLFAAGVALILYFVLLG